MHPTLLYRLTRIILTQFVSGTSVTFTASPVNEGTSPVYEWLVNDILVYTGGNTFTYVPEDWDAITVKLYSSLQCSWPNPYVSDAVYINVNQAYPVNVHIFHRYDDRVRRDILMYYATSDNGGVIPEYDWYLNGNLAFANSPQFSHIRSTGIRSRSLQSRQTPVQSVSDTSNMLTMTVHPTVWAQVDLTADTIAGPVTGGHQVWPATGLIICPGIP